MITEDHLEQQALQWFQDTGWNYASGAVIALNGDAPERADFRAVVLKGRLAKAIKRLNPKLPPSAIEEVVHVATTPEHPSLVHNRFQMDNDRRRLFVNLPWQRAGVSAGPGFNRAR